MIQNNKTVWTLKSQTSRNQVSIGEQPELSRTVAIGKKVKKTQLKTTKI